MKLDTLYKILRVFNDVTSHFSIRYISQQAKMHYTSCYLSVEEMIKEGILKKVDIGNSFNIGLDLDNEKVISLISALSYDKREKFLKKNPKYQDHINQYRKRCDFLIHIDTIPARGLVIVSDEKHGNSITIAEFERMLLKPEYKEKVMRATVLLYPEKFWMTLLGK